MSSTKDLLLKAHNSAEAARGLCEDELYDDATSRAYYAMFDACRAMLYHLEPSLQGSSHKFVLSEFSRLCVKPGRVDPGWGKTISRAQGARHVADYDRVAIGQADATKYTTSARQLVDLINSLVPAEVRPIVPKRSARETLRLEREEEKIKGVLVNVFRAALIARNERCSDDMLDEIELYGTRESLTNLIVNIDELQDVNSYIGSHIPIPSLG